LLPAIGDQPQKVLPGATLIQPLLTRCVSILDCCVYCQKQKKFLTRALNSTVFKLSIFLILILQKKPLHLWQVAKRKVKIHCFVFAFQNNSNVSLAGIFLVTKRKVNHLGVVVVVSGDKLLRA